MTRLSDTGDTNQSFIGAMHALGKDGSVVWRGWDGNDYEVFYYDSIRGNVVQVTDNDYDDGRPRLDGAWIAWSAPVGGSDTEILRAMVPEPGTCALVLVGKVLGLLRRRRGGSYGARPMSKTEPVATDTARLRGAMSVVKAGGRCEKR